MIDLLIKTLFVSNMSLFTQAILESGELGMIKRILAEMHIPSVAFSREDIRFNYSLAGGATMDGGKLDLFIFIKFLK